MDDAGTPNADCKRGCLARSPWLKGDRSQKYKQREGVKRQSIQQGSCFMAAFEHRSQMGITGHLGHQAFWVTVTSSTGIPAPSPSLGYFEQLVVDSEAGHSRIEPASVITSMPSWAFERSTRRKPEKYQGKLWQK
jgi:hypothetical protein